LSYLGPAVPGPAAGPGETAAADSPVWAASGGDTWGQPSGWFSGSPAACCCWPGPQRWPITAAHPDDCGV